MLRLTLPLMLISLTACVGPEGAKPSPTPVAATACGAEKVAHFIGSKRSDALAEEIKRLSGAERIRWIAPGQMVTMDFSETRLNVRTGPDGRITTISCG